MKRVHYVNMGPWPYFVGFTTCQQAFQREMRRMKVTAPDFIKNTHSNATTHFLTRSGHSSCAIVCIPPMSRACSKEQYAALLAHEAVHVLQDMRDKLGDLGIEAEAYIVQGIVQEGLQIAWKTNRVTSRKP